MKVNKDSARILTYRFLDLSYVVRIRIANELGLYLDEDKNLNDIEIFKKIFNRACSQNILDSLWDKIEEQHNDGKYPINPFKKEEL